MNKLLSICVLFALFLMMAVPSAQSLGDFAMSVDTVSSTITVGGSASYEVRLANSGVTDLDIELTYQTVLDDGTLTSTVPSGWYGLFAHETITVSAGTVSFSNFTVSVAKSAVYGDDWEVKLTAEPVEKKALADETTITTTVSQGVPSPQIRWALDCPDNGTIGIGGYREYSVKVTNLANTAYSYEIEPTLTNNSGTDATWKAYVGTYSGFTGTDLKLSVSLSAFGTVGLYYDYLYIQVFAGTGVNDAEFSTLSVTMTSVDNTSITDTTIGSRISTATDTLGWHISITSVTHGGSSYTSGTQLSVDAGQILWFEFKVKYYQDVLENASDVRVSLTKISGTGWSYAVYDNTSASTLLFEDFGSYLVENWANNQTKTFALKMTAPTTADTASVRMRWAVVSDVRNATASWLPGAALSEAAAAAAAVAEAAGFTLLGAIAILSGIIIVSGVLYLGFTNPGKKTWKKWRK